MATIKATPRMRYGQHKANAKKRGIEFDLTFDEWMDIWRDHYASRGAGPGQLQMCRTRDEGGYSAENVRIDTREANLQEAVAVSRSRAIEQDWVIEGQNRTELRGWLLDRRNHSRDYFKERIAAERAAERGDCDDDG